MGVGYREERYLEVPADEMFERLIDALVLCRYEIDSADQTVRGVVAHGYIWPWTSIWNLFGQATGTMRLAAAVDVAGSNGSLVTIESAPAYRPMEATEGIHRRAVHRIFGLIETPRRKPEST